MVMGLRNLVRSSRRPERKKCWRAKTTRQHKFDVAPAGSACGMGEMRSVMRRTAPDVVDCEGTVCMHLQMMRHGQIGSAICVSGRKPVRLGGMLTALVAFDLAVKERKAVLLWSRDSGR